MIMRHPAGEDIYLILGVYVCVCGGGGGVMIPDR